MLARLTRDGGTLYLLLAIYFAVNAALRIALGGSLELQESRLFFLSQWLAPGYGGQAPLAVWMQYWVTHVLGAGALSVILLENLLLFLSYLLLGWAAFLVIRNRAVAIIAVLGMLLLPQVVYELQRDGGESAAVLMASAFFVFGLFAMLGTGIWFAYALAGIAIGAGFLASYEFAVLFVAAFLGMLLDPTFRARLLNWRILFTLILAGAVLGLHVLWLRDNLDLVVAESLARIPHHPEVDRNSQIIEGLFSLIAALVGFFVPAILVFWLAFGRRFQESWRASSPWSRLLGRIFLLALLAFVALIVFGGASAIHDRWLVPFFFLLPLYFSLKLDALNQTIGNAPNRFAAIAVLILMAIPLVLAARVPAAMWIDRYGRINAPNGPGLETILAAGQHPPTLILAEDAALAGNLRLAARGLPVAAPTGAAFAKGYAFDTTHPLLLVWRSEGGDLPIPEALAKLLSAQVEAGAVTPVPHYAALPYRFGKAGDSYRFGFAWIYPPTP